MPGCVAREDGAVDLAVIVAVRADESGHFVLLPPRIEALEFAGPGGILAGVPGHQGDADGA